MGSDCGDVSTERAGGGGTYPVDIILPGKMGSQRGSNAEQVAGHCVAGGIDKSGVERGRPVEDIGEVDLGVQLSRCPAEYLRRVQCIRDEREFAGRIIEPEEPDLGGRPVVPAELNAPVLVVIRNRGGISAKRKNRVIKSNSCRVNSDRCSVNCKVAADSEVALHRIAGDIYVGRVTFRNGQVLRVRVSSTSVGRHDPIDIIFTSQMIGSCGGGKTCLNLGPYYGAI